MPKHHPPPPVADVPAGKKPKRPKHSGPSLHEAPEKISELQPTPRQDIDPLTHSQTSSPPENLNAAALITPLTQFPEPTGSAGPTRSTTRADRVARAGQTGATTTTHADADAGAGVGSPSGDTGRSIIVEGVEFHHASEAEFARLLTYYGIEWQYEPHQFALQWREGRPTEMFTPDFYLPEYDLYIELTTMRQSLVRRKNRKLRLLRALYPDINIKLLYRRDYQRLLNRFGIRHGEPDAIEE